MNLYDLIVKILVVNWVYEELIFTRGLTTCLYIRVYHHHHRYY